jgi:lysophospholipase L1-like esterase
MPSPTPTQPAPKPALKLSPRKKFAFAVILAILTLAMMEGSAWIFRAFYLRVHPNDRVADPLLGWRSAPNLRLQDTFKHYGEVNFTTTRDGFRIHGNPDAPRFKILVVGDSVTQARKIPDGRTYMDMIARELNVEMFAYGAGGYGNLQEYLIMDECIDRIKPGLVLLQACGNDFTNNRFDMEARSRININHLLRPYLEDGQVVVRYPSLSPLFRGVLRHSMVAKRVAIFQSARMAAKLGPSESDLLTDDNVLYRQARETTRQILEKFRARAGTVPVVVMYAGNRADDPALPGFEEVCKAVGLPLMKDIPAAIQAAKESGLAINGMPDDPHWNVEGNRIAGEHLARWLRDQGFVPAATPAPAP